METLCAFSEDLFLFENAEIAEDLHEDTSAKDRTCGFKFKETNQLLKVLNTQQ